MKTKHQQRADLQACVARISAWVAAGNWLGASWPSYPELQVPPGRDAEIWAAIPHHVKEASAHNFLAAHNTEVRLYA